MKKTKKKKKSSSLKKVLLIVLIVLVAVLLAVAAFFFYELNKAQGDVPIVARPTDVPATEVPAVTPAPENDAGEASASFFATIDPSSITPSPTPEPTATPEPTPVPAPIYAVDSINDDIINILLVGIDPRNDNATADDTGNSDSMMIVSVNTVTKRVCIFSLMRDGAAYIDDKTSWYDKINKAYSNGGVGMLINTLNGRNNFQLDIQNYISITFKMFEDIIDLFGGVEIYLSKEECEWINHKIETTAWYAGFNEGDYELIPVADGVQNLNGEVALWYCRNRYTGGTADWGRTERQRKVLLALYEKVRKEWTFDKLLSVIDYVAERSSTNLSIDAIIQLATLAMQNEYTIEQTTIPFPGTSSNAKNSKKKFVLKYDMPSTRDTLLNIIYKGEPMPTGVQTDFSGSNED